MQPRRAGERKLPLSDRALYVAIAIVLLIWLFGIEGGLPR